MNDAEVFMLKKTMISLIAILLASGSISVNAESVQPAVYKDVAYHGVEVNGGEVIKGVDISSVISLENSGVVFKNESGMPKDIFLTLKEAGVNYIRVRIWNDPFDEKGNTYGGGANDINTAVKIARRCAEYDLKMLVDFHYSDFWADPSSQKAPKAWENYSVSQKADAIRSFTMDSLKKIKATGVEIGMVQVGNETLGGMCGETEWDKTTVLMKAASETIRTFDKNILIAVHFPNPAMEGTYEWISGVLDKYHLDYDVFATSYYPFWHGSLDNLTSQLKYISEKYNKYVMVAETSWLNSYEDFDGSSNTLWYGAELGDGKDYGISEQGQIDSVSNVFQAIADVGSKGIGVFYWEPAWIKVGDDPVKNAELWEKYGSGAGTVAAGPYNDWEGASLGSAVDNQALFDQDGKPLSSLYVFKHIYNSKSQNLIQNPGFENDGYTVNPSGWQIKNTTSGEHSKFEIDSEQNRTGKYAAHWYSPTDFKESRLTCECNISENGEYEFTSFISGENASYTADIYINGEWKCKDTGEVSGYGLWNTVRNKFSADKGDRVKIEFIINGWDGSYGSIDDCSLYKKDKSSQRHKGDVLNDELIKASDIMKLRNYFLGIDTLQDMDRYAADMNSDDRIDIMDFILLKNKILTK